MLCFDCYSMNSLNATRTKSRSATARPLLTPTPATVRVKGHGVPIEPGLLHTLVEAVSTAVEERLDASDQLLHQAIDAVAANVDRAAAWYTDVLPGAKTVGSFAGCQCNMSLWDALYHACAQVCSLSSYSWPSKCQIQVPNSSLACSHHLICTGVSLAPCFYARFQYHTTFINLYPVPAYNLKHISFMCISHILSLRYPANSWTVQCISLF